MIRGWDEGIVGLCKGAKAILVVPPDMGYGDRGAGSAIPGGATLNFDVEVVDINGGAPRPEPTAGAVIIVCDIIITITITIIIIIIIMITIIIIII